MLLGRFVFREQAKSLSKRYPIIEALDKALESEGLKLMLLMRLCPLIPFSPLNYIMGITSVSIKDFCFGLVSITPATCVYVFIGTTISSITEAISGKGDQGNSGTKTFALLLLILGSALACFGIIWVSIVAKRNINASLK